MDAIGVIGLGAMGGGVAANLLKAGRRVWAYDLNPDRNAAFEKLGARAAVYCGDLADACGIVMLFLPMAPFDPAMENLLLGEGRFLERLRPGAILVDCGNTSPAYTRHLAELAGRRGVGFVDAAASGGETGAKNGTLSIMAGGAPEHYEKVLPVLRDVSSEVAHYGPAGMGQAAKLVNNMLVHGQLALLSEVMVFAAKCGLDMERLIASLSKGAAASWVLDNYGKGIWNRPQRGYETPGGGFTGARQGGRDKQLAWAIGMADDLETPLPMTAVAYSMFQMARGMGKNGLFEPIVSMLEDMTDVTVCRNCEG